MLRMRTIIRSGFMWELFSTIINKYVFTYRFSMKDTQSKSKIVHLVYAHRIIILWFGVCKIRVSKNINVHAYANYNMRTKYHFVHVYRNVSVVLTQYHYHHLHDRLALSLFIITMQHYCIVIIATTYMYTHVVYAYTV